MEKYYLSYNQDFELVICKAGKKDTYEVVKNFGKIPRLEEKLISAQLQNKEESLFVELNHGGLEIFKVSEYYEKEKVDRIVISEEIYSLINNSLDSYAQIEEAENKAKKSKIIATSAVVGAGLIVAAALLINSKGIELGQIFKTKTGALPTATPSITGELTETPEVTPSVTDQSETEEVIYNITSSKLTTEEKIELVKSEISKKGINLTNKQIEDLVRFICYDNIQNAEIDEIQESAKVALESIITPSFVEIRNFILYNKDVNESILLQNLDFLSLVLNESNDKDILGYFLDDYKSLVKACLDRNRDLAIKDAYELAVKVGDAIHHDNMNGTIDVHNANQGLRRLLFPIAKEISVLLPEGTGIVIPSLVGDVIYLNYVTDNAKYIEEYYEYIDLCSKTRLSQTEENRKQLLSERYTLKNIVFPDGYTVPYSIDENMKQQPLIVTIGDAIICINAEILLQTGQKIVVEKNSVEEFDSKNYTDGTLLARSMYMETKYKLYSLDYATYPIENINVDMTVVSGELLEDLQEFIENNAEALQAKLEVYGAEFTLNEVKLLTGYVRGLTPEQIGIHCEDLGNDSRNMIYKYINRTYPHIHNYFKNNDKINVPLETVDLSDIYTESDYAYLKEYNDMYNEVIRLVKEGKKEEAMSLNAKLFEKIAIETYNISEAIRTSQQNGTSVVLPVSPESLSLTFTLFNAYARSLPEDTRVIVSINGKDYSFVNFDEDYEPINALDMLKDFKDQKNSNGDIVLEAQMDNIVNLCLMGSYDKQHNQEILLAKGLIR